MCIVSGTILPTKIKIDNLGAIFIINHLPESGSGTAPPVS